MTGEYFYEYHQRQAAKINPDHIPKPHLWQGLSAEQRFWRHVDPCRTDGCALFLTSISDTGYGVFWDGQKSILAHHFLVGKPSKGYQWDHVLERGCIHRNCVWPDHLELVSPKENTRRNQRWR